MQSTVNDALVKAVAGGLYGLNHNIIGRNNYSKKLDEVTITAIDLLTTCTINGTAFTANAGAGAATKTAIAEELATLINAGSEPVTAYFVATAEKITVESDVVGTTTTVVGTTNCTVVAQIGNAAAIDFGLFVCQDLLYEDVARVPIVATDITNVKLARGIVCHDQAIEQFYQSAGGEGYGLNREMSIVKEGMIWVVPETAMAITDDVYARYTVSGATKLGGIRNDDDTSKAAIIPSARVIIPSAAAGLCLVELNLP
jgi:hypothetical protein